MRFNKIPVPLISTVAVLVLLCSCQWEEAFDGSEPAAAVAPDESVLSLRIEEPGAADTKSVINASGFDTDIRSLLVYLVASDGSWKKSWSTTGPEGLSPFVVRADGHTSYDLYVLANMGQVPFTPQNPASFAYTLPDTFSSLNTTGLPMCGQKHLNALEIVSGGMTSTTVSLRRLLSKVNITVNKSPMVLGANDGSALVGGRLRVAQVSKVLRPFASLDDRRAQTTGEVYPSDTDWHNFTVGATSVISPTVTLYVSENCQGIGSGPTQKEKTPAAGRAALATYLEYTATKDGSSDGVSGHMTYRTYLGENETDDFNVKGNNCYNATLNLSWNGIWEGSWRVTTESFSDSRKLVISDAANSATEMVTTNTKAGSAKVRKGTATRFYLNYFPGGAGQAISHGRKDQSGWPYGYVAVVDGNAIQMTGTSGTIRNAGSEDIISWTYTPETDCLALTAIPGAPASTDIHTLKLQTTDGRKSSEVVYFTTSIPFEFRWRDGGKPDHVAQRGILEALDADTHQVDGQGIFHVKDGYGSKVRMTDNGDGTATVALVDGFTGIADALYIEDADGDRHCDVPLEARLPWFECTSLWTTYVDAASSVTFTYYAADEDGAKTSDVLKVSATQSADGYLAQDLVEELIAPAMSSTANRLGKQNILTADGSYTVRTFIASFTGIADLISGASFKVADASYYMSNIATSVRPAETSAYWAFNPWKNITTIGAGGVMNDYTLYREPNRESSSMVGVGWRTTPVNPPTETASYSMNLQNIAVASLSSLSYDASFQDGGGYLGSKVCTSATGPQKVAWDYASDKYTLWLDVTDPAMILSDITGTKPNNATRLYDYLYGRGFQFTDLNDMYDYLQKLDFRMAIGSAFTSTSNAYAQTPSPSTPDVGGTRAYGIQGTQFTAQSNADFSSWTLDYSMAGLTADDVSSHGAGKIDVKVQISNPYSTDGIKLEKKVAEAYVKLHLYIWAAVDGPFICEPYGGYATSGWCFTISPYCVTENKTIQGLQYSGYGNIFERVILDFAGQICTSASIADQFSSSAGNGRISPTLSNGFNVSYRFQNNSAFSTSDSEAMRKRSLRQILATPDVNSGAFTFKSNSELTSELGGGTFWRKDAYTLYYDPSGNNYKYTYDKGSDLTREDKLFVFHLALGAGISSTWPFYFDASWGF